MSTALLIAVAGYGGFRLAAHVDLGAETGAGLVVLAVITGFAVSPLEVMPRVHDLAPIIVVTGLVDSGVSPVGFRW